jgi:hypothetical protein
MKTIFTDAHLFEAEQACRLAHRALGIKKAKGTAKHKDYLRAEDAARHLDGIRALVAESKVDAGGNQS